MIRLFALAFLALLACAPAAAFSLDADPASVQGDAGTTHTLSTHFSAPEGSGDVVVAMNIVNLRDRNVVDPEDWSPQRTQYIDPLNHGEERLLYWTVNAILPGEYAVYFVAIETPTSPEAAGRTVASEATHLIVHEAPQYNPGGILPYSVGVPLFVAGSWLTAKIVRRRQLGETKP